MSAQLPDKILHHGEWIDLYSNPLEQYWIKSGKNRPPFFSLPDCTRGYIARWEIQDSKLFFNNLEGIVEKRNFFFKKRKTRFTVKSLFSKNRGLVKADWFSGKLRIPIGKMTLYEHNGYDSRFEKEQIITIEKGDIIKIVTLDFTQKELVVDSDVSHSANG